MSRMTEEIGRVLGGRYRIIAPIGRGASAQVFLADDVRLRRRVAVKMLHAALADDVAFLRRFQAEAQAAAALNHPHVMAVYDWGNDDGIPYLVLEYLGGGSLRGALDGGGRLSPSQALLVGLEAGRGLEYAHGRGLVHRDIKPANLLFGDDARLRIADFGLARALAEAAWTEPQGAVLGTARYASPEQAQGRLLSGKADVYSLALVLVEAVTGSVPFVADTTFGTLMARVDRDLPVPDELGPLRAVLEGAGKPDPEQRLDARDLVKGLLLASKELQKPASLPLAGAVAAAGLGDDPDPTMVGVALSGDGDGDGPSFAAAGAAGPLPVFRDDAEATLVPPPSTPPTPPSTPTPTPTPTSTPTPTPEPAPERLATPTPTAAASEPGWRETEPSDADESKRRRRWPWVVLALVLLSGIGVGAGAIVAGVTRTPTHVVPTVVGLDQARAKERLAPLGWQVGERHVRRDGQKAGTVVDVVPRAGTDLKEGKTVTLVISDGNTETRVPSGLGGKPQAEAEQAVRDQGLEPDVRKVFDEVVAADHVIRLGDNTPSTRFRGDPVLLIVSRGPRPRIVPDNLVGMGQSDAVAALARVQLLANPLGKYHDTVKAGVVLETNPGGGAEAARDSTVDLAVSRGPRPATVPAGLVGLTEAEAKASLAQAGLVAKIFDRSDPDVKPGVVIVTEPKAGAQVARGSTVDVAVSTGPKK